MSFRHPLEVEIDKLRKQLDEVSERVRIHAVASAWRAGNHDIRERDYFLLHGDYPTRLNSVSSDGKWTYCDRGGCIEPFRIPNQADHDRLYTKAEVAEIVASASAQTAVALDHAGHLAFVEPDLQSIRRGGTTRKAACVCGWRGPERGTLELAVDDALNHERLNLTEAKRALCEDDAHTFVGDGCCDCGLPVPVVTKREDGAFVAGPPPDGRSIKVHLEELTKTKT